uniref:Uncharacterized protein n=1 Tax=Amphilophus citrinellus TaxID=61819 RepID=A0A3Q0RR83_AMPCI
MSSKCMSCFSFHNLLGMKKRSTDGWVRVTEEMICDYDISRNTTDVPGFGSRVAGFNYRFERYIVRYPYRESGSLHILIHT